MRLTCTVAGDHRQFERSGCTNTSGLKLKFVAHLGEVAIQTIRRRKKLVGLDVIHGPVL